jgi:hypothetical protein
MTEVEEPGLYKITFKDGSSKVTSRDYTGWGKAEYIEKGV